VQHMRSFSPNFIEERSRRTKLVAFSPDRTIEIMQEKLVSIDVEIWLLLGSVRTRSVCEA
jgi:hypothetical protein